ncbi:hypothetical protein Lal_00031957 [Lupinus albus]|nr:hypothetical protein Lal_00031957 [Lupinus albus]
MYTKSTASRAANASMSAHETTPGHLVSICDLAFSITSKPLNPMFGNAFLSAEDPAIRTEPSHPCVKQTISHGINKIRTTESCGNLDKTIMEMKPKQARSNGRIFIEVGFNCGPYYDFFKMNLRCDIQYGEFGEHICLAKKCTTSCTVAEID